MHTLTYYRWQNTWLQLRSIWANVTHEVELTELMQWAERKRLKGPQRFYKMRLHEVDQRLFWHQVKHQKLVSLVRWLHVAYYQIIAKPTRYKRGYASKYRSNFVVSK